MTFRSLTYLLATLLLLPAAATRAEKADSQKEIHVEADQANVDNVKQINIYTGNVIMTQGTLIMKGVKLVETTSPEGFDFFTLYAPPGGRTTMRQKRDGGPDLWMEGEATDRMTYDQKTSIAVLYENAKVRRLTGTKTTDESNAAYLSYNTQTEIVNGANTVTGVSKPGEKRVVVIIQPHAHPAAQSAPGTAPTTPAAPKDAPAVPKDANSDTKDK